MEILGFFSAIIIGFTLGLIGGGGSILTVPVLVYIFGIDPVLATGYSLFVVGVSSVVGSLNYMREGLLHYRAAFVFAVPSFLAVYATRKFLVPSIPETLFSIGSMDITGDVIFFLVLIIAFAITLALVIRQSVQNDKRFGKVFLLMIPAAIMVFVMRQFVIPAIPDNLILIGSFTLTKNIAIMVFFALIMILSSVSMISNKRKKLVGAEEKNPKFNYPLIVAEGGLVGTVTGIVGAGGGFLIVPALVLLANLPMKLAVGTSLLIISAKSLIGFLGDVSNQSIDWTFLLSFTGLAVVGIVFGSISSKHVPAAKLKQGFGWFVLLMGIYIFSSELLF
ncbi:MAG: sulfite exporter TauE/SafE family protein [Candidatus Cyclobacteriaceae bacterium M3_2C_046]